MVTSCSLSRHCVHLYARLTRTSRTADPKAAAAVAALIPVTYWGPFFVALFVPGAAIVDPGHQLKRFGGIPSPLFGASATILVAGPGWYLDHRGRTVEIRTVRSTF
jgi:hypothetical protein